MLEGLVASLLNRFLGMYVRNFDPKKLNVGIWSGDVTLRSLELRREALDQLRLPINVVYGHIGLLTLSIPWSNLKGQPVKVFIEDVYLVAAPKANAEYDEDEEARRQHALKMEKLDSAELLKEQSSAGMSEADRQKHQSFMDSLVTKVVDNLQISVKRIHLRYEDSLSTPEHPFALGITLAEFSAVSTDESWHPKFIHDSSAASYKLVTLGALAIYWNTDAKLLGTGKGTGAGAEDVSEHHEDIMQQLRNSITDGDSSASENHQCVLKPVSGRANVRMDKTDKHDNPRIKAGLLFEAIGVVLDEDQYRDALMMLDLFHYFTLHQKYKKYRPKGTTPKEDPRAWIRFAGEVVLKDIHERNYRQSWAYLKQRRDDRRRYIELFKKKKREQAMTAPETEELHALERKLSYEDMRFWRSLARSELRKENASIKKAAPPPPPQKQGWGSWIWGSGKQQQTQNSEHKEEPAEVMTDQHRKELYEAIEWDEKAAIAASVEPPRDSVKVELDASLRNGSFTLKQDPHGRANKALDLRFDDFQAKIIQRPDSLLARLILRELSAYGDAINGNLFTQIVKVKKRITSGEEGTAGSKKNTDQSQSDGGERPGADEPFFEFEFEQNPLDNSADYLVSVKLKSIELIYNPLFIMGIVKFFQPPERHMEAIGTLMETAGATVEGLRQQTLAGGDVDDASALAMQGSQTLDPESDATEAGKRIAAQGSVAPSETGMAASSTGQTMNLFFRADIVDAQVILIANPSSPSSEAIVLSAKHIVASQQYAMTLQVSEVGMFLCRMDKFNANRLRILDDFGLHMSMQSRSQSQQSSLTSIHVGVEPLVLRLSLRDILLAIEILNKASELSWSGDPKKDQSTPERESPKRLPSGQAHSLQDGNVASSTIRKPTRSAIDGNNSSSHPPSAPTGSFIMRREEMLAEFEGIRVILIGDLHELPLLDLNLHDFSVGVRDWSGDLNGDTTIGLYLNVYNFSKSAWEPLIEPWQLGFHLSQHKNPDYLSVELYSRKTLELTLTTASIALASRSARFLSQEEDVLSKPRGVDAPYRIKNQTGFDLSVWTDGPSNQQKQTKVSDGAEIPWRFEDWEKVRENLTPEGGHGMVSVRLEGSGFEDIVHIPVRREGETIYNLRPKRDKVVHRLLVEVRLGKDNIKFVTFRSPLLIENKTQIPIEVGVYDSDAEHLLKIEKIPPDDSRPAPIGAAYVHSVLVRPDPGFGYAWSEKRLFWRDLLKRNVESLTCKSENGNQSHPFYFQMNANFEKNNPLTG